MSGCLDRAQCPNVECPNLADKRNQIASIAAGALVSNWFAKFKPFPPRVF